MPAKIISLFNSVYYNLKRTNYEGAPAFKDDLYHQTVKVLTTGTFEPTFYASARDLSKEAIKTLTKMCKKDPEFLAKAILYARVEGLMRLLPITALVILSAGDDRAKHYTRLIFNDIIRTPGDLQDFIQLIRIKKFRSSGRLIKSLTNQWLANISEYHVIKYGSENQKLSLRDIYRITRPKLTGRANEIARYVVKGELSPSSELHQIQAYERFKITKDLALIEEFNLPYEVVTAQLSTPNAWKSLFIADKLPFMFMLRNINNAYEKSLLQDERVLDRIVETLTDPVRVSNSMQFPYRFYCALKSFYLCKYELGNGLLNRKIAFKNKIQAPLSNNKKNFLNSKYIFHTMEKALIEAIDLSLTNFPEIKGQTFIGLDFSGSMCHRPVSKKSNIYPAEISNLFGAAIFKKSQNAEISGFTEKFIPLDKLDRNASIAELTFQLNNKTNGGGTSLSEPLKHLLKEKKKVDNLIVITDSISWFDHYWMSRGCMDLLKDYKQSINPDIKTIVINLMPYKMSSVNIIEPDLWQICGWSDAVLKFIPIVLNGTSNQIQAIKDIQLKGENSEADKAAS